MALTDSGASRSSKSACPEPEHLAEFAEAGLSELERRDVERHLVDCADCRTVLMSTSALLHRDAGAPPDSRERETRAAGSRWRGIVAVPGLVPVATAATILLMIGGVMLWRLAGGNPVTRPELRELGAALARSSARMTDGRLGGGFEYREQPSFTREAAAHRILT